MPVICFLLLALVVSSIYNGISMERLNAKLDHLNAHYKFYETEKYDDRFEARERRKASDREKMRRFAEERTAEAAARKAVEFAASNPPLPAVPYTWKESRREKMKRSALEAESVRDQAAASNS
jgi:hypothetical protein